MLLLGRDNPWNKGLVRVSGQSPCPALGSCGQGVLRSHGMGGARVAAPCPGEMQQGQELLLSVEICPETHVRNKLSCFWAPGRALGHVSVDYFYL